MRQKRNLLLPYVVLILLFWALGAAAADRCPRLIYLEGAVPQPGAPDESIRMDTGEVTIRLGPSPHVVDAVFEFSNTGETSTQRVGIPTLINSDEQGCGRVCPSPVEVSINDSCSLEPSASLGPIVGLLELEVWVHGRKAILEEERDFLKRGDFMARREGSSHDTPERRWVTTNVTFPGHAKTTIRCRYKIPYAPYHRSAGFAYGTGRVWKGNIGKFVFIIDCADVGGIKNVDVETDFAKDSRQRFTTENLIIMEERDFKPDGAAHLSLNAYRYYHEISDINLSQGLAAGIGFPNGPPAGQPSQMLSRVDYDPKLADPFFKSNEWSYPWYIIKHPDGHFESTISDQRPEKEPPHLKHTAECFSNSGGEKHLVKFCKAKLLDANVIDLFIYESNPSEDDALSVQIRNGMFACQYWTVYRWQRGHLIWTTKRQKLTLDKKVYRKGDMIKGRIEFECEEEETHPEYVKKWGKHPVPITVNGVFKTIVE